MQKKRSNNKKFLVIIFLLLIVLLITLFFILTNKNKKDSLITDISTATTNSGESQQQLDSETEPPTPSVVESLSEEEIKLSKERGLPVLMYHFFYDKEAGETGQDNNFMEIHDFEEQVKYLSENGYYVPTWDEVLGYINGDNGLPLKSVVITVDDGAESFFRLAVPVLEKYNFKATSFVITSWLSDTLKQTSAVDYQSHSHDMHKAGRDGKGAILTLSYDDACSDLKTSRSIIGDNCKVFCYPFGHFNDQSKKILKDCDYILSFTTKGGRVYPGSDPYALPRVRMSKGDSLKAFINKVK